LSIECCPAGLTGKRPELTRNHIPEMGPDSVHAFFDAAMALTTLGAVDLVAGPGPYPDFGAAVAPPLDRTQRIFFVNASGVIGF
jgi:hypothetical protein